MKTLIIITLTCVSLTSCKKTYTCTCVNPGGVIGSISIKDTRKKANKKCDEYAKTFDNGVVFSEIGCNLK